MCNVIPNRRMAFTLCLSVLVAGCGIKWATNRVLSNPDAIAKVGAVYDVLTPRDTTERLVFIEGDSIVTELHDTVYLQTVNGSYGLKLQTTKDTIRINTIRTIRRTDTIKITLPPDNRAMARLLDSLGKYTNELNQAKGSIKEKDKGLKTANNRIFWMAGIILVLGIVIGLLLRFKVKL
jgi:hypothetical protein